MAAEHVSNDQEAALSPPAASPTSGRHPTYRGIRSRSGKWVSEIRKPRQTTRIWLGTYPTAEMAAAAYDVAALALKGPGATINFPSLAPTYPIPASFSAEDIRAAAASTAASISPREASAGGSRAEATETPASSSSGHDREFIDEEALLDMPQLLVDMAEGMLVSPPRMKESAAEDEDSPEDYYKNDRLWSYP